MLVSYTQTAKNSELVNIIQQMNDLTSSASVSPLPQ